MVDPGVADSAIGELRPIHESSPLRFFRPATPSEGGAGGLLCVLSPDALLPDSERHVGEFLLFRRCRHPHWPESVSYRITSDGRAIWLANVPGSPLSECRFVPGWDAERREICRQLLSALDALHRTGHTHGRLAREHVFLDRPANPRFGLPHVTLVDLGLMAPGRPLSGSASPRVLLDPDPVSGSDAQSFAKILHELLTGSSAPPVAGEDMRAIYWKLPAEIPRELRRLLAELLAQPEDGPSMAAIWTALRRIPAPGANPVVDGRPADTEAPAPAPLPHKQGDLEELVSSTNLPFLGRDREIARFRDWIQEIESVEDPSQFRCTLRGEGGIGCRALAEQLIAHAESRGWIPSGPEPGGSWSLVLPRSRSARFVRLHIEDRRACVEAAPSPARSTATSGSAPDRSLTLSLWQLAPQEMETLARTRLRSPSLIERAARISAGNPRLLQDLLATIPPLVDSVSHEHPGSLLELEPESAAPPTSWVEWAQDLSRSVDTGLRRVLVAMAVAGTAWPLETIEGAARIRLSEEAGALDDLARRGLVDLSSPPAMSSPLWESAWRQAEPELGREIARALLRTLPLRARGDLLQHACRLAIDLSLWDELAPLLDRALIRLNEAGQHTPEFRLLTYAIERVPPAELPPLQKRLSAIGRAFLWCDRWEASLLPSCFEEGRFPVALPEDLASALTTWARLARCESGPARARPDENAAARDLARLPRFDAMPMSLEWLFAYLATRPADSLEEETVDWLLGLAVHPRFGGKPERVHLGSAALRFCRIGSPGRRRELLRMIGHREWSDGIRAGLLHLYESETAHGEGRPDEARAHSRRAEDVFRRFESWSHHLRVTRMLAELAHEEGDLLLAYRHWRRSLQTALETNHWRTAVHVARRLVHCALARGDFGQALAAFQRIRDLQDRFGRQGSDDLAICEADLALDSGDLDILAAREHTLDDAPWRLRARGLAEMLAGHLDEGRWLIEHAFERLRSRDPEAAAELLLDRLICETDLLQQDPAVVLYDRLAELEQHLTGSSRLRLLVAQGAMVARGWIAGGPDEEQVLIGTALRSHETDSGSTTWRARWNLSIHYDRCAQIELAERRRREARQCLEDIVDTLPRHRRAAFLSLPGPCALITGTA